MSFPLHQPISNGYFLNLRTNSKPSMVPVDFSTTSNKEQPRKSESLPRISSLPSILESQDRSNSSLIDWLIGKPYASPPPERIRRIHENQNSFQKNFQKSEIDSFENQQSLTDFSTPPRAQPLQQQKVTMSQFIEVVNSTPPNILTGQLPATKKFHHRKYLSESNFDSIIVKPQGSLQLVNSSSRITIPTSQEKLETMNSTAEEEPSPIQLRFSTQTSEYLPSINVANNSNFHTTSQQILPSIGNINSNNIQNTYQNDHFSPLLRENNNRSSSRLLSPFNSSKRKSLAENTVIAPMTSQSIQLKDSLLQHSLQQQPTATAQHFFTPQRSKIKSKTTIIDLKSMIHAKADFPLISRNSINRGGVESNNQQQSKWNSPQAINDFLATESQQKPPSTIFSRNPKKTHSLIDSISSNPTEATPNRDEHFLRRTFVSRNPHHSMTLQPRDPSESKALNEDGEIKVKSILKAKHTSNGSFPIKKKSIKIEETLNVFHLLDKKN